MRIDIQTNEMKLGQNFKRTLKSKIKRLLEHNIRHIHQVSISLRDVNGPKGGDDKLCKVNIFAGKGKHILVSVRGASALKAATLAIRKANNALHRQLGKARVIDHTSLARVIQQAEFNPTN